MSRHGGLSSSDYCYLTFTRESRLDRAGRHLGCGPANVTRVQQQNRIRAGAKIEAQSAADVILTAFRPRILNAAMQAAICLVT